MDKLLERKIKSIIRNETGLGKEKINTADIYNKLIAARVEVPDLALAEILEKLVKERLITLSPQVDQEDQEKHGAYFITWVSKAL